jgi:hypothetical protein
MKLVGILLAAMFLSLPASVEATPPGQSVLPPVERTSETAEIIVIGAGTMYALLNIGMMTAGDPSYAVAGVGIGLGLAAIALTAGKNPAHETGLFAGGAFAIGTGLIAIRHRHVLNDREGRARVEPTWHRSTPAVALVIGW